MTSPHVHLSRNAALTRMHVATVLFGMSGIFGQLCASSAMTIVCGRALFSVTALGLLCLWRHEKPCQGLRTSGIVGLILSGVLLTAHFVTFFQGIKLGGIAIGTLGFACFPVFTALFESIAYGEKPRAREWQAMLMVAAGLCCIAMPDTAIAVQGLLWGILSAGIYGLVAVVNRRISCALSGTMACWWQNMTILGCLLPCSLSALSSAPPLDWLWFGCLGILCTALAYSLYINSLTAIKARQAAIVISLEPVYAILMAWMLFGEQPGIPTIAGGLLVLGAALRVHNP